MALLNEAEQRQVAAAIAAVEKTTDAELVTVLAARADDYYYIPTLWAALAALVTPAALALTPLWLEPRDLLLTQWAVFVALALALRFPPLMCRLIPRRVGHWRAGNLARRQFLDNNLHHTRGANGVLVFVAEAEHYVEIIADRGISRHVDDRQWQAIVDAFTAEIRAGRTRQGLLACIERCGELLSRHAPASEEKNELPDHLVVLR